MSEIAKLRDDIQEAINVWDWMQMDDDPVNTIERVIRKLREALSSHTEDTGILKVREIRQFYVDHGDFSASNVVEEVLHALGITIPGIKDGESHD